MATRLISMENTKILGFFVKVAKNYFKIRQFIYDFKFNEVKISALK
jgi:hypothetical protein